MYIADDEGIRRPEQVVYGDIKGRNEWWFSGRVRTQLIGLGLLMLAAPVGFQIVFTLTPFLGLGWRSVVAVVVGAGAGIAVSALVSLWYAKYDKPATRIDYYGQQAVAIARAPKEPAPPVEIEAVIPASPTPRPVTGAGWATSTPPPLSHTHCTHP